MTYTTPTPISRNDVFDDFDCGNADLNSWLQDVALDSESRTARTYVVEHDGTVVAYYCIAAGEISRLTLPTAKLRKNTPPSIPVIVIGRLAVDLQHQNQRLGKAMLRDAIKRAIELSKAVGIRAVIVHAIDDRAAAFYEAYGFIPSRGDSRLLLLPIETAIDALTE